MTDFAKRTILVLGQKVELVTESGFPITDISTDLDRVAAQMAWWASVWAAAERQEIEAEATYRQWKSMAMLNALNVNPKDAEWKIKLHVEGSEMFLRHQKEKALAKEACVLAKGAFEAFSKKANSLQSRGASERGIMERQGLTTPANPKKRSASMPPAAVDEETKEPPAFTTADDESDDVIESKPVTARPSSEEMVASIKARNLLKKKAK